MALNKSLKYATCYRRGEGLFSVKTISHRDGKTVKVTDMRVLYAIAVLCIDGQMEKRYTFLVTETNITDRRYAMRSKNPEYFKRLEDFINEYRDENGTAPSNAEMAEGTGLSSATVSRYLSKMKEDGHISYDGHRTLRTRKMQQSREGSMMVPVLGQVACGLPRFAEENIEEYIPLPKAYLGPGAKGDSMIDIGIDDGDLVLVRQQKTADPGQVVVALIGDEATLKRFYPDPDRNRIRLHPENREMNDIFVDDCEIQGIAVKVIKDII